VGQQKAHGIIVYSYGTSHRDKKPGLKLPPLAAAARRLQEESARLGEIFAPRISPPRLQSQGRRTTDYYVLKNPSHPSVLVELGFLTNPTERRKLTQPAYQKKLSDILAKGIEAYLTGL